MFLERVWVNACLGCEFGDDMNENGDKDTGITRIGFGGNDKNSTTHTRIGTRASDFMVYMFGDASAFNQDIGSNTEKVTSMVLCFIMLLRSTKTLGVGTQRKVTNMETMFSHASAFNQDIGGWNTEKVTNMGVMFHNASAFNSRHWELEHRES